MPSANDTAPDKFFDALDGILARLSRAAFLMLWTILFIRAAASLDEQHSALLVGKSWLLLWPLPHLVYKLFLLSAVTSYLVSSVQIAGVGAKIFRDLAPKGRSSFLVSIILVVLLMTTWVAFSVVGFASLIDDNFRFF